MDSVVLWRFVLDLSLELPYPRCSETPEEHLQATCPNLPGGPCENGLCGPLRPLMVDVMG